jgi:uncharacterized membrane protein YphA (DoxX/SURF4 family)
VNNRWSRILTLILRIILGAIFIYAAIGKIADPSQFANDIAAYRLLPLYLVNIIALILPYLEILAGLGLVLGVWLDACIAIVLALIAIFIFAAGSAMLRGLNIECGCFTLSSNGKVGWDLITRDTVMLAAAVVVFLTRQKSRSSISE